MTLSLSLGLLLACGGAYPESSDQPPELGTSVPQDAGSSPAERLVGPSNLPRCGIMIEGDYTQERKCVGSPTCVDGRLELAFGYFHAARRRDVVTVVGSIDRVGRGGVGAAQLREAADAVWWTGPHFVIEGWHGRELWGRMVGDGYHYPLPSKDLSGRFRVLLDDTSCLPCNETCFAPPPSAADAPCNEDALGACRASCPRSMGIAACHFMCNDVTGCSACRSAISCHGGCLGDASCLCRDCPDEHEACYGAPACP